MSHGRAALRLLVVDDHNVVRAGLCALLGLEPDFKVVGQAADGAEAVVLWKQCHPDVTLMDLSMPVVTGVEAIRQIHAEDATAVIIVLTTYEGDEDIYSALRAGAKGYLLKDTEPSELCNVIRSISSGRTQNSSGISAKLAQRLGTQALTEREHQILQKVVQGLTNHLIGCALDITEGTVKSHLRNIFQKLDASSRTEATAIAIKRGIVRLAR